MNETSYPIGFICDGDCKQCIFHAWRDLVKTCKITFAPSICKRALVQSFKVRMITTTELSLIKSYHDHADDYFICNKMCKKSGCNTCQVYHYAKDLGYKIKQILPKAFTEFVGSDEASINCVQLMKKYCGVTVLNDYLDIDLEDIDYTIINGTRDIIAQAVLDMTNPDFEKSIPTTPKLEPKKIGSPKPKFEIKPPKVNDKFKYPASEPEKWKPPFIYVGDASKLAQEARAAYKKKLEDLRKENAAKLKAEYKREVDTFKMRNSNLIYDPINNEFYGSILDAPVCCGTCKDCKIINIYKKHALIPKDPNDYPYRCRQYAKRCSDEIIALFDYIKLDKVFWDPDFVLHHKVDIPRLKEMVQRFLMLKAIKQINHKK